MKKINYKSDFSLLLNLYDDNGNKLGFPSCDFYVRVFNLFKSFKAYRKGETLYNIGEKDGMILVICDNHQLGPGKIRVEIMLEVPNDAYPDGVEKRVYEYDTDVELVGGNTEDPSYSVISMTIPNASEIGGIPSIGDDDIATEEDIKDLSKDIFGDEE